MKKLLLFGIIFLLAGAGCFSQSDPSQEPVVDDQQNEFVEEANIIVDSPSEGSVVSSPVTVIGRARVFEGSVSWRIKSTEGDILEEGFFTAVGPDVGEYGDFEERLFLPVIDEDEFVLELLTYSARDGSEQDVVSIPLQLEGTEVTSVEIYFVDPSVAGVGDCSTVDFEKRTVTKTANVAELAILELLKGPESEWAITEVPEFTTLNSITIEDGVAYVDFGGSIQSRWNGGACHVTALRAQIEQTLLQFPTVSSVQISLNGNVHDILTP